MRAKHLSSLLLASFAVVVAGSQSPTLAADKKVVVEQFDGSDGDKLRQVVKKVLKGMNGIAVVSDKKLASVEADLGLMQTSDSYEAVAKELEAAAFIGGKVKGGKQTSATITVKDAAGKAIGSKSFKAKNSAKLMSEVEGGLAAALTDVLAGASAPTGGGKDDKKADKKGDKQADKQAAVAAKDDKKKAAPEEKPTPASEEKEDQKEDQKESEESGEEEATVAESADEPSEPSSFGDEFWTGLDVTVGTFVYQRKFDFNDNLTETRLPYELPLWPAVAIAADYFFLPYLGVTAGGDITLGASSEDDKGKPYSTSAMGFFGGPKGKYHFGALELNAAATFGIQNFTVGEGSKVSPVGYTFVRGMGGARFKLGTIALTGGFGYLHVLSVGDLANDFPGATAAGTEGNVGAAYGLPWGGLEARVSVVVRQYGLTFNPIPEDPHKAGGARDRYVGLNIGVGYRMK